MAIGPHSTQSRGMVVCTLVLLTLLGLYSAVYEPSAWMWLVWSLLAIATTVMVLTEKPL